MRKNFKNMKVVHYFDILVHTKTFNQHITSLGEVLNVFKTNGLTAKPNMTEIVNRLCVFLGRLIEEGHINPDQTNIYKILEFRTPQNKKQILGS